MYNFSNISRINPSVLDNSYTDQKATLAVHPSVTRDNQSPHCTLKWRQGQLLVNLEQQPLQRHLPSLNSEQWLVKCLKHSPVRLVRIDPAVGKVSLKLWAEACEQANKPIFLRLPTTHALSSKRCPKSWWLLKRLVDWSAAALLLLVLSPVMLGIVCLMRVYSPGPILLRQWCVGERGKLFRLLKFRTMVMNAQTLDREVMGNQKSLQKSEANTSITPLGRWMRKYSLDRLPGLFNILQGEMSLVGPHPWTLYDAVRISPEKRQQLKLLPGIIGALQSEASSNLLDLDAVNPVIRNI
jgi:lipopolysaccharide/colanic/teichoic acid biosynthesis glycosyltransferase